jgi:hypothetical protein
MAEPTRVPPGDVEFVSLEELRQMGRDRLMTYFLAYGATPPDDPDDMARAAHELIRRDPAATDWTGFLDRTTWASADEVLRDVEAIAGPDPAAGGVDGSAA